MYKKSLGKIVGYSVPIVALVIGSIAGVSDTTGIEHNLSTIAAGVAGILAIIGVAKSHDK